MGGLGSSVGGGSGSSGSSKSSTPAITQNASTATAAQPVTVANVPRLSGGGLVTHQTLAIVGDSPSGGDQREAVIPLNDAAAMRDIMHAFAGSGAGGVGDTIHNYHIQGMISTSDLTKLSRAITRGSNTGRLRVTVADSSRVTRRG
jgi:hypothetical protein